MVGGQGLIGLRLRLQPTVTRLSSTTLSSKTNHESLLNICSPKVRTRDPKLMMSAWKLWAGDWIFDPNFSFSTINQRLIRKSWSLAHSSLRLIFQVLPHIYTSPHQPSSNRLCGDYEWKKVQPEVDDEEKCPNEVWM